jgi:hypothetical protein
MSGLALDLRGELIGLTLAIKQCVRKIIRGWIVVGERCMME